MDFTGNTRTINTPSSNFETKLTFKITILKKSVQSRNKFQNRLKLLTRKKRNLKKKLISFSVCSDSKITVLKWFKIIFYYLQINFIKTFSGLFRVSIRPWLRDWWLENSPVLKNLDRTGHNFYIIEKCISEQLFTSHNHQHVMFFIHNWK